MNRKAKVGVMTFHASYNFGSVMQAWATQKEIEALGYECEIINFRPKAQKDKYAIFPIHSGVKTFLRSMFLLKYASKKAQSNKKYKQFIDNYLNLSGKEINDVEKLCSFSNRYDISVAGSDQIWAYHVPEFDSSRKDIRKAYYLSFAKGKKIAYGSSLGATTKLSELHKYKDYINEFSAIAVRENSGRELVQDVLGREVGVVLDPTYLIPKESWGKMASESALKIPDTYLLIYSLQGIKKAKKWSELCKKINNSSLLEKKLGIVSVSPFAPITGDNIIDMSSAGPLDILKLFNGAEYILTDTFHGMSFSIHFRKQFILYEESMIDERKSEVLENLRLGNRVAYSEIDALALMEKGIDYNIVEPLLDPLILYSKEYLCNALKRNSHE